jgi:hypothetical protein
MEGIAQEFCNIPEGDKESESEELRSYAHGPI